MVAIARWMNPLDTLVAELKPLMRLSASRYFQIVIFIDAFYFDWAAQNCLRYGYGYVGVNILLIPSKYWAWLDHKRNIDFLFAYVYKLMPLKAFISVAKQNLIYLCSCALTGRPRHQLEQAQQFCDSGKCFPCRCTQYIFLLWFRVVHNKNDTLIMNSYILNGKSNI